MLCLALWGGPTFAKQADEYAALAAQDLRLAAIAEPMLVANAHLCRAQMPVTGIIFHSADQYGEDTRPAAFTIGQVVIADVVEGSPAEQAGLRKGDVLRSLAGQEIASLPPPEEGPMRDAVFDLLAQQDPAQPLPMAFTRPAAAIAVELDTPSGCLTLFEITTEKGMAARSDGRVIQITYPLAALASDEQLAVIFAHELAHSVLEHRARLSAAGISKGFFGEFGRNQRYNREVEIEADRMMVHLLANAGYDPGIAPAFFRSAEGRRVTGGMLSFVYPSPASRAGIIEREIEMYLPLGATPTWPGHLLALRDSAFAGD